MAQTDTVKAAIMYMDSVNYKEHHVFGYMAIRYVKPYVFDSTFLDNKKQRINKKLIVAVKPMEW